MDYIPLYICCQIGQDGQLLLFEASALINVEKFMNKKLLVMLEQGMDHQGVINIFRYITLWLDQIASFI